MDDISALLGLNGLTAEELGQTFEQIADVLMQAISIRVVPLLSPGEQLTYEELLNTGASGEDVYTFLKESIPDLDKIAEEEVERMRETLKAIMPPLTEAEARNIPEE